MRRELSVSLYTPLLGDLERRANRDNMTVSHLVEKLLMAAMYDKNAAEVPEEKAVGNEGRTYGLSDEALEAELAGYPSLDDAEFEELSREEFHLLARSMSRKPMKGVEKWL